MEYHSTQPVPALSRVEVVDVLAGADHGFLAEPFCLAACRAFGVTEFIGRYVVDSGQFKGLQYAEDDAGQPLPDGTAVFGAEASALAEHICRELGVRCMGFHGRGSQLRECVRRLREWLAGPGAAAGWTARP